MQFSLDGYRACDPLSEGPEPDPAASDHDYLT